MPRKPPPAPPKGTRHPGAGRVKGKPNRISVEVRALVGQLVGDPLYQHRLRADFRRRKVHPTIESLIWTYHLGKPTQRLDIQGGLTIDVDARLEEERRIFGLLDISELEQLAAESQRLVDRAAALAKAREWAPLGPVNGMTPQDVVVESDAAGNPSESLGFLGESDNESSVNSAVDSPNGDNPNRDNE